MAVNDDLTEDQLPDGALDPEPSAADPESASRDGPGGQKDGGLITAGKIDEYGLPLPQGTDGPAGILVAAQTPGGTGISGDFIGPPVIIKGPKGDIEISGDPEELEELGQSDADGDILAEFNLIPMKTISGTSSGETIISFWPRVTIYGYGGNDWLVAFGFENNIYGGSGDDIIFGYGGVNRLYGQVGEDRIIGFGANNRIYGGAGNDTLTGQGAINHMRGNSGDDVLRAFGAWNKPSGGIGNDRVFGFGAYNDMQGGLGNDLILGAGAVNLGNGGLGDDFMIGVAGQSTLHGGDGSDAVIGLIGANRLYGEGGKDVLVGAGTTARLWGGTERDVLLGTGPYVELRGEAGDDIIIANALANILRGGADRDILIANGVLLNNLDGGAGADFVYSIEQPQTAILKALTHPLGIIGPAIPGGLNVNKVTGGAGNDIVLVNSMVSYAYGGTGNDFVIGTGTGVRLEGEAGDDRLFSIALGANLIGGAGNDIVAGLTYRLSIPTPYGVAIPVPGIQVLQGRDGSDLLIGVASGLTIGPALLGKASKTKDIQKILDPEKLQLDSLKAIFQAVEFNDFTPGINDKKLNKKFDKLFENKQKELEAAVDQLTGPKAIEKLLNALPSVQFQFAGADDDIAISLGQAGVQFGQQGNDILVAMADRNIVFGGDGDDLILLNTSLLNFASGGDGNDWILDVDVLGRLMLNSLDPDRPLEMVGGLLDRFSEYIAPILELKDALEARVDDLLSPVADYVSDLSAKVEGFADEVKQAVLDMTNIDEIIATLQTFFEAVRDFIDDVRDTFNLELPESRGGTGNDVLAASATDSVMVGGDGDDTYLFMFGRGEHAVEDAGTVERANDLMEKILALPGYGEENIARPERVIATGGDDAVEIYGRSWLDVVDLDDLVFEKMGDDLTITLQGKGNKIDPEAGSLTLRDMDDDVSRIEELRVQTDQGIETFNLAAAWLSDAFDADNFDFSDWRTETLETSPTETAFETAFDGWSDTIDTISGQDLDLAGIRDAIDNGAQDLVDLLNAHAPDSLDFA